MRLGPEAAPRRVVPAALTKCRIFQIVPSRNEKLRRARVSSDMQAGGRFSELPCRLKRCGPAQHGVVAQREGGRAQWRSFEAHNLPKPGRDDKMQFERAWRS